MTLADMLMGKQLSLPAGTLRRITDPDAPKSGRPRKERTAKTKRRRPVGAGEVIKVRAARILDILHQRPTDKAALCAQLHLTDRMVRDALTHLRNQQLVAYVQPDNRYPGFWRLT